MSAVAAAAVVFGVRVSQFVLFGVFTYCSATLEWSSVSGWIPHIYYYTMYIYVDMGPAITVSANDGEADTLQRGKTETGFVRSLAVGLSVRRYHSRDVV